jgi:endoglucanase
MNQLQALYDRLTGANGGSIYYDDLNQAARFVKWLAGAALLFLLGAILIYWWRRGRHWVIASLVALAVVAGGLALWVANERLYPPLVFSDRFMLESLWRTYKTNYVEAETGRTIDKQRGNITTSEGQAYTMLRAVWQGDQATFDQSWQWTEDNLERPDKLFAWLFGERADGTYGILTEQNGQNTASDADVDIALALIFAYSRWQDDDYLRDAMEIIPSIWEQEVLTIRGQPYLLANNVDKSSTADTAILNPSYFAPYAYRIFATIDEERPWLDLVDSSYEILEQSLALPLDRDKSAGLPPDWLAINKTIGRLSPPALATLSTNYGFDAMRVPWRLALDAEWFGDARAKNILEQMDFLAEVWQREGRLGSTYTHDGKAILTGESPAMYGTALAYFYQTDKQEAATLYRQKLLSLYEPDFASWKIPLGYYDDNLAWFGLALYSGSLPNLHALSLR